jgi:tRNA modification GTPase
MTDSRQSDIETIVAISTPPGRGGIGIVRLAGPEAVRIADALLAMGRVDLRVAESHARAFVVRVLDLEGEGSMTDSLISPMTDASVPSGAEAPVFTGSTTAGLKPRPFKTGLDDRSRRGTIDDAVVTAFHGPRSYTGDDVVEIAAHGSPVILEAILRGALALGARLAGPGEFTQRAFVSGRLDLTQAEAVHDLIAAQTLDQARVAAQQMGGALSRRVAPAKERLLHLIAMLEAGMDFASGELDDVDVVPAAEISAALAEVRGPLAELAASFRRGQLLREGASIALVGRPNAGKSSLFNRLLERERAIVTPIPGTTRDTLEESLALGGIPLRLVDTAGLREGSHPAHRDEAAMNGAPSSSGNAMNGAPSRRGEIDEVERLGMERTREAVTDADLVLYIKDVSVEEVGATAEGADPSGAEARYLQAFLGGAEAPPLQSSNVAGNDEAARFGVEAGRPHLVVHNKIDLLAGGGGDAGGVAGAIRTSAVTGAGLDELREAILGQLNANGPVAETGLLNNLRQQQAVVETLEALGTAAEANAGGLPHEVILMDLHVALRALDSLTGATTTEDILARIFSTFCIGK